MHAALLLMLLPQVTPQSHTQSTITMTSNHRPSPDGDDIRSHHQQQQQQQHRLRRLRPSSRGPTTLRPLAAELSPLSRSDGSASLRVGNTHVLCAVHGPTMPRNARHERCDRGVVSVAFSRGLLASSSGGGVGVGDGGGAVEEQAGRTPPPTTPPPRRSRRRPPSPCRRDSERPSGNWNDSSATLSRPASSSRTTPVA